MVIDELIVVLGIDARQFTQQQREALDAFRRMQQEAEKAASSAAAQGQKLGEVFGLMRRGALGVVGALVGGEAAAFIEQITTMDAVTGRFSKTVDANVETVGVWQSMLRQVGGSAEDARAAIGGIQQELNNVRQGGGMFSEGFGYLLNKIGGAQGKDADTILRQLNAYFQGEISAGRETPGGAATYLRRIPGMNEAMIQVLLGDMAQLEAAAKKVGGATRETSDAAQELQSRFTLVVQAIERWVASLLPLVDLLMKPLKDWSKEDVGKALKGLLPTVDEGSVADHAINIGKRIFNQPLQPLNAAHAGTLPSATVTTTSGPGRSAPGDREGWIRALAQSLGIDPQVAMNVAKSEGFNSFKSAIPGETSYGDYQLHTGGGLGDVFRKRTGLDPTDPKNERAMDEFALKWAATHGWGAFHGAANTGIGQWQGIGARGGADARAGGGRAGPVSNNTSTTNIGKVEVHTQATDAEGIAADMAPAIKHAAITAPANTGLL